MDTVKMFSKMHQPCARVSHSQGSIRAHWSSVKTWRRTRRLDHGMPSLANPDSK